MVNRDGAASRHHWPKNGLVPHQQYPTSSPGSHDGASDDFPWGIVAAHGIDGD
jgi:hypothetical protein